MTCTCSEMRYKNERGDIVTVPPNRYHSCQYVKDRNALSPEAVKIANAAVGRDGRDNPRWSAEYMKAMQSLYAAQQRTDMAE